MKRILSLAVLCVVFQASLVFAAVVEDWTGIAPGNTGSYQDSNGSKADFVADAGPKGGQKALKITANKVANGYVGVYHTVTLDLSKSGSFKFMAKSTVAGDIQMAIVDAFNVQYVEISRYDRLGGSRCAFRLFHQGPLLHSSDSHCRASDGFKQMPKP